MPTDRELIDAHLPLRPVEFHILLSLSEQVAAIGRVLETQAVHSA